MGGAGGPLRERAPLGFGMSGVPGTSWALGLGLVAFLFAKASVLSVPYYWDEAGAYVSPALWLADAGLVHALPGMHPPTQFFGHPPGTYFGLAVLYQLFGHSIWLTHAVAIGLAMATLHLTFRVGELIEGPFAGLLSALLLALNPLFFAQAGMMHGDMSVAVLGLAATLFYLQGRFALYAIAAVAAVLCKETGLAIVAGVSAYHLLFGRNRPRWLREMAWLASPGLALAAFFLATWMTSGQMLNNPYFTDNALLVPSADQLRFFARWLLVEQGRWVLVVSIAAGLVGVPGLARRPELALLALLVLPFCAAFSLIYFLPRYLLPTTPYFSIAAATALVGLGRMSKLIPAVAVFLAIAIFAAEAPGRSERAGNYELNLGYVEVAQAHAAAAKWLSQNRSESRIGAAWPLSMVLRNPNLGYVTRPLHVVDPRAEAEILAWSAQGEAANNRLLARARNEGRPVLATFGRGNRVAVVFGPPPSGN